MKPTIKLTDNQWHALNALYDMAALKKRHGIGDYDEPQPVRPLGRWFHADEVAWRAGRIKPGGAYLQYDNPDTPWARTHLEALVKKGFVAREVRKASPNDLVHSAHPEYSLTETGIHLVEERRAVQAAAPDLARQLTGGDPNA